MVQSIDEKVVEVIRKRNLDNALEFRKVDASKAELTSNFPQADAGHLAMCANSDQTPIIGHHHRGDHVSTVELSFQTEQNALARGFGLQHYNITSHRIYYLTLAIEIEVVA